MPAIPLFSFNNSLSWDTNTLDVYAADTPIYTFKKKENVLVTLSKHKRIAEDLVQPDASAPKGSDFSFFAIDDSKFDSNDFAFSAANIIDIELSFSLFLLRHIASLSM